MSLVTELTTQLSAVALLLEEVAATRGAHRRSAYADLTQRAAAYAWTDSHVVVPALRRARWRGVRSDLLTASAQFQRALAEMLVVDPDASAFAQSLIAFRQAVSSLTAVVEQDTLAGALQNADVDSDPLALLEVGRAFAGPPHAPFDLSNATALVQDASIVLASLPAERPAERSAEQVAGGDS
jgi:hypothetical protein